MFWCMVHPCLDAVPQTKISNSFTFPSRNPAPQKNKSYCRSQGHGYHNGQAVKVLAWQRLDVTAEKHEPNTRQTIHKERSKSLAAVHICSATRALSYHACVRDHLQVLMRSSIKDTPGSPLHMNDEKASNKHVLSFLLTLRPADGYF